MEPQRQEVQVTQCPMGYAYGYIPVNHCGAFSEVDADFGPVINGIQDVCVMHAKAKSYIGKA